MEHPKATTEAGASRTFSDPKITINRVYTRHGDEGKTGLVGGQRVSKDDLRIEAYGTVDELNAFVGAARQTAEEVLATDPPRKSDFAGLAATLARVQHELFNLGSILATLPEDVHPKQPRITQVEVDFLETEMDTCQKELSALRSFVLPGGTRLNVDLHVCRTVCRRAERNCVTLAATTEVDPLAVAYLNRLSDAFFVWSRFASHLAGTAEWLWNPNLAASARPPV